jgi:hypothetical protein
MNHGLRTPKPLPNGKFSSIATGETPYAKSAQAILWKTYGEAMPVSYASYGGGSRRPNPGLFEVKNEQIKIYPNPTQDQISISWSEEVNLVNFIVYDIAGRVIFGEEIAEGVFSMSLNLSNAPPGILFFTFSDQKGGQYTRKVVRL